MAAKESTTTATRTDLPADALAFTRTPGVLVIFARGEPALLPVRTDAPMRVGRSADADLTIDDGSMSRFHAELESLPGGVGVTDLGSHNGTWVGGVRVVESRTLAPFGTAIRLGKALLLPVADLAPYEAPQQNPYPTLVGGPALAKVRQRVAAIALAPFAILIEGETGTGKEVLAAVVHAVSERVGRFVPVNCAALAHELIESELFGHVRGSFSGSAGARAGLFRAADRGTLLLDEIGELPVAMQAKLLRVLETGEVRAVGDDSPVTVNVRIVAATNRDLDAMVGQGTFRGDLLHRIAGARVALPPLRQRLEDLPRLAEHFLASENVRIGTAALERLLLHAWPGNVRELRHSLLAAASTARHAGRDEIRIEDLGIEPTAPEHDDAAQRRRVVAALAAAEGNVSAAAEALGVGRSAFYETLRRLGLDPASFRKR